MIHLLGGLLHAARPERGFLRLLDYLSVRSIAAALTAILITMALMPVFIRHLHRRRLVDQWRDTGIPSAFEKAGTPVMGGAVMVGAVLVSCLLWCNLTNRFLVAALAGMIWFGTVGLIDDLAKLKARSGDRGLSEAAKLVSQGVFALLLVGWLASSWTPFPLREALTFYVPFLKTPLFSFAAGYFVIVFFFVILVGNAVNITDGMDGLAIVPSVFVLVVLGVFAYVEGNYVWASYLQYPFLRGAGELTIFCAAFAGAGIGFLWFNAYPAQIFMGDAGALAIGGSLATLSVLLKQEALFVILGGLFIAEALSSQIQDKIGIKWLGRRIFSRAPFHHQMQHDGLAETKVVVRLWIVSLILALAALATLKVR
jgi:phospho-N-acetylmuramoyl-pentapeptide-transferase